MKKNKVRAYLALKIKMSDPIFLDNQVQVSPYFQSLLNLLPLNKKSLIKLTKRLKLKIKNLFKKNPR